MISSAGFEAIDPAIEVPHIPANIVVLKTKRSDGTFDTEPLKRAPAVVSGLAPAKQAFRDYGDL
jgi:hypothetical protein